MRGPYFYNTKFMYGDKALSFYIAFEDINNLNIPRMAVKAMKLSA